MKRLLMIAYHFPPFAASSGIQRTLGFARHLPEFGWEPLILTAHPRAYEHRSSEHLKEGDRSMIVERAFALDAARHLSLMGRYPRFMACPDRWLSWWLGAVPTGLTMIRKYRPHAIWSTFPIATAHKIARTLQSLSALPWIADFRDPMAQDGYPEDPKAWQSYKCIEERVFRAASRTVFVTAGAAEMYRGRYAGARVAVIENGYDEQSFKAVENSSPRVTPRQGTRLTLLHSGVVYPIERDPTQLFRALRRMLDSGSLKVGDVCVRLRAAGHNDLLSKLIDDSGVGAVVELAPPLPYRSALQEMMSVDGLLILQAGNCNQQVPAKLYEYLRCGRPVLALTDPEGDTAAVLRNAGLDTVARLDSADDIAEVLKTFLNQLRAGEVPLPNPEYVVHASRMHRTAQLAKLLDELTIDRHGKHIGQRSHELSKGIET